jgi:phosphoglycerol transferase MdoB-like AlkP superfamily enzyme
MRLLLFFVLRLIINSLFAFSLSRIVFLLVNHSRLDAIEKADLFKVFFYALPLDFSLLAYAILIVLLLFFVVGDTYHSRAYSVFEWVFFGLVFGLNLIDSVLFDAWGSRINLQAFFYLQNIKGALASVTVLQVLSFVSLLFLQLMIVMFISEKTSRLYPQNSTFKRKGLLLLMVVLTPVLLLVARGGIGKVPINQTRVVYSSNVVLNTCAINPVWNALYYLMSTNASFDPKGFTNLTEAEIDSFERQFLEKGPTLNPSLSHSQPNIVLLIMESLSAETIKNNNGALDWSTGLSSWYDSSFVLKNVIASGNRTDKGLLALLSGFPAMPTVSLVANPASAIKLPSITCQLANKGYQTGFLYGGDIGFANLGYYLQGTCMQNIYDKNEPSHRKEAKGNWGFHDASLFSVLKDKIRMADTPFFITALSLSAHEPFDIPGRKGGMEAAYRYSDSCLTDFISYFRNSPHWDNTLLVITGDHGRDLYIQNRYFFDPYKFRIPFIVMGGPLHASYKGYHTDMTVSQTDCMPFLLHELGFDVSMFSYYLHPFFRSSKVAAYFFDNGFGVVSNESFLLFHNPTKHVELLYQTKENDETAQLLTYGKSLQQSVVKKYLTNLLN